MAKIRITGDAADLSSLTVTDEETGGKIIGVDSIKLVLDPTQQVTFVRLGFRQVGHIDLVVEDPEYSLVCFRCCGEMDVKKRKDRAPEIEIVKDERDEIETF